MSLLERVRAALAPDLAVQNEIAAGGMGVVYLALDKRLNRTVAIKIMRPEMLTAELASRFQREARILATMRHPGVVKVFTAGEADGLNYYVMEYIDCPTLKDKLAQGRLTTSEIVRLATSLLDALAAAHDAGVVHRDIKPANIFYCSDQSILSDFGISRHDASEETTLTRPNMVRGTPRYMSPEQASGSGASQASDLYSFGICLYEAASLRPWNRELGVAGNDWTAVPRPLLRALRKALQHKPHERWGSAREFKSAIVKDSARKPLLMLLSGLAAVALTALAISLAVPGEEAMRRFTLEACEVDGDGAPGVSLALGVHDAVARASPWLDVAPDLAEPGNGGASDLLRCQVSRRQQEWRVIPTVVDSDGNEHRGSVILVDSLPQAATPLTAFALSTYFGNIVPFHDLQCPDSVAAPALAEWVAGELSFARDDWSAAVDRYDAALALQPSFATAKWRRFIARRWARRTTRRTDLAELRRSPCLSALDQALLQAVTTEPLAQRIAQYRRVFEGWRDRSYAALFYGNELFHRGPLAGISLERSIQVLEEIREPGRVLAPAENQIIWGYIRLGDQESAARALQGRLLEPLDVDDDANPSVTATNDPDALLLLQLAFSERFNPGGPGLDTLVKYLEDPDSQAASDIETTIRLTLSLDIPHVQVALGQMIAERRESLSGERINGHIAAALGHLMVGHPSILFEHLSAAFTLSQEEELLMFMNEAPLLLPWLGLELPDSVVQQARSTTQSMTSNPRFGWRALWALAMDAIRSGDSDGRRRYRDRLSLAESPDMGQALATIDAYTLAAAGDFAGALAHSQSVAGQETGPAPDPFARALIKWGRATWREALGHQEAQAEWLWYENTDFGNWPSGTNVQPAEIDWALSTYARIGRARTQLRLGPAGRAAACRNLTRVLELWTDVESVVAPFQAEANSLWQESCQ